MVTPYHAAESTAESQHVRPCVVLPTCNNSATLAGVLSALRLLDLPVIVVDDGSSDNTPVVLARWRREYAPSALLAVRHTRNLGKADALRTGFRLADSIGATHAVTIDADGQHNPADVPGLLAVAVRHPHALVVGVRQSHIPGCPPRCLLGRRLANAMVFVETMVRLVDTQCGLRVYPLGLVRAVRCRAGRFSFETEILVRASWAGCTIIEAPVSCVYDVPEGRVSHWRPVVDTLRDGVLHIRLLGRSFMPVPHARWPHEDDEVGIARGQMLRAVAWISPRTLWRRMRDAATGDTTVPASLALGAFIGCSPFYGLHAWLSLYWAWRFRLPPLPAVLGSMISTPPIGIAIVVASIHVGGLMLMDRSLRIGELDPSSLSWWALSWRILGAWLLGSIVVGGGIATLVFFLAARAAGRINRPASVPAADHEPV